MYEYALDLQNVEKKTDTHNHHVLNVRVHLIYLHERMILHFEYLAEIFEENKDKRLTSSCDLVSECVK